MTPRAPLWYRILLRLLPAEERARWGAEYEDLLLYRLEEARGPLRRAAVRARAALDLMTHAPPGWGTPAIEGDGMMKTSLQDAAFALKGLRSTKGLALLAAGTLALGIGAATATFSVVETVLLRDLPYGDPDGLVVVWPTANFNAALTLEVEALPEFAEVSGASNWTLTLTGEGEPLELTGTLVSAGHFELLGRPPALGRTFRDEEVLPGRADVAILSHDLWVRAFGADPTVIGRTIALGGAEYERRTVIGVMPASHQPVFADTDLWIPLEHDPAVPAEDDSSWYVNDRVARLAPGVSLERADAAIARYATEVGARLPAIFDEDETRQASVVSLSEHKTDDFGPALIAALGSVALVLLIACANVANLLLVRGESRTRDLAVRSAMGASQGRVIRMLLAEGAIIGVVGGLAGILMAQLLLTGALGFAPPDFPRIDEISINGAVLGFSVVATLFATILAGVLPALRIGGVDGTAGLTGSVRGAAGRTGSRLSRGLVGFEIALAVVVAVGSGLMLRSLDRIMSVDTGLNAEGVLTFRANPPAGRYPDGVAFFSYYDELQRSLENLPGVTSVGAIQLLPGTSGTWSFPTFPEGVEVPEGAAVPSVNFRAVRAGYFETVGLPTLRGRVVTQADGVDDEPIAVVNQAFVDRFWPGEEALGRSLRIFSREGRSYRVVGVVADVRQHGRMRDPLPEMYYAHGQVPWDQMGMYLMVRFDDGQTTAHAAEVREAVWAIDPDVPITGMEELSDVFGRSAGATRFLTLLLTGFGAISLLLGGVGVFGVTSHLVGRRAPEFGVRIALGSSRRKVLESALGDMFAPAAMGLGGGVVGALLTSRLLESMLYDVRPADPVTFAAVVLLLAATATLAALRPAVRASRVDPVTVLNSE